MNFKYTVLFVEYSRYIPIDCIILSATVAVLATKETDLRIYISINFILFSLFFICFGAVVDLNVVKLDRKSVLYLCC